VKAAPESGGASRSEAALRAYQIEVSASVSVGRLQVDWLYSDRVIDESIVAALADRYRDALEELIAHCISRDTGGYTPSDFPEAQISQQDLESVLKQLTSGEMEDDL
jgi:non-ribosomal peptide synthase protein (TIGR01720 family)